MWKSFKEKLKSFGRFWMENSDYSSHSRMPPLDSLLIPPPRNHFDELEFELRRLRTSLQGLQQNLRINTMFEEFHQIARQDGVENDPLGPFPQREQEKVNTFLAERARLLKPYHDIEDNLRESLSRLFNRDEQSFTRFMGERITYLDQGMEKVKDEQLINFSLFIPRRKTLTTDFLKTIILSIQGSGDGQGMLKNKTFYSTFNNENLPLTELETNEKMSQVFNQYKDEEIKNLFTRRYYIQDWISIVRWALSSPDTEELPVFKSLREIQAYLKSKETRAVKNKGIESLPMIIGDLSYNVLKNNQEVFLSGYAFNNCLKHNFYPDSDLISVKKENKLVALVEVNSHGTIAQIKGELNSTLNDHLHQEIIENIKKLLTK